MKRLRVLSLSLLMLCGVSVAAAQSIQEAGAKFEQARELLKANKVEEAIPVLEQSIEMADAVEEDENAVTLSEQAKKMLAQVYLKLGVNDIKEKKYDQAIAAFAKAEDIATRYGVGDVKRQASRFVSSAYLAKGIDSFNNKDYTTALEVFKQGYEMDDKNIKLVLFIGQAYAETGDLVNASEMFKKVIDAGAENSKYAEDATAAKGYLSSYFLVDASKAAGENNIEKVIASVENVLAIDPTNGTAHLLPIQVANNLKKYDIVIERAEKALTTVTDEAMLSEINLLLGVAYQNKDNKAKALEALGKVTGAKGNDAKAIIAEINK